MFDRAVISYVSLMIWIVWKKWQDKKKKNVFQRKIQDDLFVVYHKSYRRHLKHVQEGALLK